MMCKRYGLKPFLNIEENEYNSNLFGKVYSVSALCLTFVSNNYDSMFSLFIKNQNGN